MSIRTVKKLLCLLAATVMCAGMLLLASCNKETEAVPDDTSETDGSTESPAVAGFPLVKDGVSAKIVYSYNYEDELKEYAEDLALKIKKYTGVTAEVSDDVLMGGKTDHDDSTVEILLGDTNYDQSEEVYATLADYGECRGRIVGNKLVIASWDVEGILDGIMELTDAVSKTVDGSKNVILASDYSFSVYSDSTVGMARLPIFDGTEPRIIDGGDESVQYVFARADSDDFADYAKALEASGYTLYTENTIENNLFKTYKNDKCVVNLSVMPGLNKVFVIVDSLSKTALPGLESDNVYNTAVKQDTLFTQVGLYSYTPGLESYEQHKSADTNGQSNVIRLEDGSFIIIDGGHGQDDDAAKLYGVLAKQAADKDNIVIAAWIFTHAHSDHVLTFPKFADAYGDKITVEQFIFNFPSVETAKEGGGDFRSNVINALGKSCFKDSKIIKAHVGQRFYIRNAEIEILSNLEMLQPYTLKSTDNSYNNTSLVFTLKLEGVKFMILGDCYEKQNELIPKCYTAETLKSDVVQIAHHGIGGTNEKIYSLVDADYAIWPAGNYYYDFPAWGSGFDYTELTKHSYNAWFNDPDNIDPDNIYWALDDIDVFTLKDGTVTVEVYDTVSEYVE